MCLHMFQLCFLGSGDLGTSVLGKNILRSEYIARCSRRNKRDGDRSATYREDRAVFRCCGERAIYMRRCVELARIADGQTRPNPIVGCVLVDRMGNIAEGFHTRAGCAHAEVEAINAARKAGLHIEGCTAYVSLEPCNHFGRTPPCSRALIREKVGRVVVGMVDPDPRTSGAGIATLRSAGIPVDVGVENNLCLQANEGFVHRILHKRPFGILKYAMTLDGKIATETGSSKWVTNAASRQAVHALRSRVDAIVVGGQTLRTDNPRLTVRLSSDEGKADDASLPTNVRGKFDMMLAPIRVVMTRSMNLPSDARIWKDAQELRTVVLAEQGHGRADLVHELRAKHVEVYEFPGLRPLDAMKFLHEQNALNVLWECGGRLAASAIADGCVQKVQAFIAPKLVGGGSSVPTPVAEPALVTDMNDALVLKDLEITSFDGDVLVAGYLQG